MKIYSPLFLLILVILLPLLQSCEAESLENEPQEINVVNAAIEESWLIGHWELSEMESDTLVDLDDNNTGHYNLLDETSCFNTMSITFFDDGTFETVNSRLDFNAGTGEDEFACLSDRQDGGLWEVDGEDLLLTLQINGEDYTDRKELVQDTVNNSFSFEVSKLESEQYVSDPGDTQASEIRILAVEYTKN